MPGKENSAHSQKPEALEEALLFSPERKALREKAIFGTAPIARQCPICCKPVIDRTTISGVKCHVLGFKYIEGVMCMILREAVGSAVWLYREEPVDCTSCECAATPRAPVTPVGTVLNYLRPFSVPCAKDAASSQRRPAFSPVFTEYSPYAIDTAAVLSGKDMRTTCMIKNIPNKLTSKQLIAFLSSIHYNAFDFVYLRMDFKSNCNNGYAFINFREARYIPLFLEAIKGNRWKNFRSEKRGDMAYARIQGLSVLQSRFRRSDILSASKEFWPILFGPNGEEVPANRWSQLQPPGRCPRR